MTIVTKPLTVEKKPDKLEAPLVEHDQLAANPDDPENPHANVVILKARVRRLSTTTTLFLAISALLVLSIGVIGGKILYHQYISSQMRRFRAQIPMPSEEVQEMYLRARDDPDLYRMLMGTTDDPGDLADDDFNKFLHNYFNEDFEIDADGEKYEKIDVPDFRDGRSGRFIHDFNTNVTGIIDITGKRCFVMPLNRGNVLPPKSLIDLIQKMWEGYYKVDTRIVRESMRVVTPPLDDLKGVGTYIAKECEGRPVYRLEKFQEGVVKRSADLHEEAKFAQFSGNKITEIDIVNFEDVKEYEAKNGH